MKIKKELLFQLIIFFLIIPFISAIEVKLSKDSYQPQETLQLQLTGNFIYLMKENIMIYKEGKVHPEPVISDLTKYNNAYYFYAILPNEEGNYTLRIENAEYFQRGQIIKDPIIINLSVQFKNTSDLSFNPGFVIPDKDIIIKVKSLYRNIPLNTKFEATGESKNIFLIEGREELIKFNLPALPPSISKIIINNYEIPVFLIKKLNETIEEKIEFIPLFIVGTITDDRDYSFSVIIKNAGNKNLTNITFESDILIIKPNKLDTFEKGGVKIINITISKTNKTIDSYVKATFSDKELFLPIFLNITQNKSNVNIPDVSENISKPLNCEDIGNLCIDNQICNGETIGSLEGPCCIGDCIEEKKSGYKNTIGIILIIILLIIIFYITFKIIKKRKLKTSDEILIDKTDKYMKRLRGEEVRGKLDKV